jgi:hypothetical protein
MIGSGYNNIKEIEERMKPNFKNTQCRMTKLKKEN